MVGGVDAGAAPLLAERLELARELAQPLVGGAVLERPAQAVYRRFEPGKPDRLGQEVDRAGVEGGGGEAGEGGDEDDERLGAAEAGELLHHVEAVEDRHFDVEQDRIGAKRRREIERGVAAMGGAHHLDIVEMREQAAQPVDGERFVVDEQHPDHAALASMNGMVRTTAKPPSACRSAE